MPEKWNNYKEQDAESRTEQTGGDDVTRINLVVSPGQHEPVRLDKYLTVMVKNATRTRVQEAIKNGWVLVNSKQEKASYNVQPNDRIDITLPVPPPPETTAEEIELDIVYEDDDLIIVNKPAGMVVHPAFGNWTGTLVNGLLFHAGRLSDVHEDMTRPGIVHRIDKDTSGLLVVARNDAAHQRLSAQFSRHTIKRHYLALVWGHPPDEGSIDAPIGRNRRDRKLMDVVEGGKRAVTYYKVVERFDHLALVDVTLETGRTHQIRVHFAHINHPVFGDATYGGDTIRYGPNTGSRKQMFENLFLKLPRQCLHARVLGFTHPRTGEEVEFDAPLPADIAGVLETLRINCQPSSDEFFKS
jgi:23S rRNA pseudouridine1911/1915/1917 synthase